MGGPKVQEELCDAIENLVETVNETIRSGQQQGRSLLSMDKTELDKWMPDRL